MAQQRMKRLTLMNVKVIQDNMPNNIKFDESDYEHMMMSNSNMWNKSDHNASKMLWQ